jgi:hypothetical protein
LQAHFTNGLDAVADFVFNTCYCGAGGQAKTKQNYSQDSLHLHNAPRI